MTAPPLELERGSARVFVNKGDGAGVRIEGVLREENVAAWFHPLIEDVHRAAVEAGLAEVVLDIRGLEYANASVWSCLVQWLRLLRQDARARYTLRVLSEPTYRWQNVGMSALRVFGADRLVVESARGRR